MDGNRNTTELFHPRHGRRPARDASDAQRLIVDRLIEGWVDEARRDHLGDGERDEKSDGRLAHMTTHPLRRLAARWGRARGAVAGRGTASAPPAPPCPRPICDGQT